MWHCPKCQESVDDTLDVCWNCGADRQPGGDSNDSSQPSQTSTETPIAPETGSAPGGDTIQRRFLRPFALAILGILLLLLLAAGIWTLDHLSGNGSRTARWRSTRGDEPVVSLAEVMAVIAQDAEAAETEYKDRVIDAVGEFLGASEDGNLSMVVKQGKESLTVTAAVMPSLSKDLKPGQIVRCRGPLWLCSRYTVVLGACEIEVIRPAPKAIGEQEAALKALASLGVTAIGHGTSAHLFLKAAQVRYGRQTAASRRRANRSAGKSSLVEHRGGQRRAHGDRRQMVRPR